MQQAVEHSGVMDSTAVAQASQVASKVSEVVKEAAHTVQGAMSVVSLVTHFCIYTPGGHVCSESGHTLLHYTPHHQH